MFLAGSRRVDEDHLFRSYESVRVNDPSDPVTTGALKTFRDETLAAGHRLAFRTATPVRLFLFTMAGSVLLSIEGCGDVLVNAGDTELLMLDEGTRFSISNPLEDELTNYVLCLFENERADSLFRVQLNRYDGREEMEYRLSDPDSRVFIWVVQGAFEVKNRLLESRDAMLVRGLGDIDAEALSNEAILLLIEYN